MLRTSFNLFKIAFKEAKYNYKFLFIVLILEAMAITLLYHLNAQYGLLYQGIQDYNKELIWRSIGIFATLALILVIVGGYITYVSNKLAFGIRAGLTSYYTRNILQLVHIESIEQRIQEDLRNFGRLSVEFWLSILKAIVKLPLFLSVILTLTDWKVCLIVLTAVVVGTLLTKYFAKRLIELQIQQESNEANFRNALKIQDNILITWMKIRFLFIPINTQLKKLTFLQAGLGQTFVLLPFIILIPLYITKAITMGAFFQAVNALSKVIDSLTILIDQRQLIADISTTVERMKVLDDKTSNYFGHTLPTLPS